MNSDISLEPLLNRKQRIIGTSKYADQVVVEGVGGSTTDREVLLGDNVVVSDTPTADVSEVHYVNTSGKNIRYGGSSITATTGGKPGGEGYVAGGSKLVPRDRWTPFRAD
jgi:hypothetical protein